LGASVLPALQAAVAEVALKFGLPVSYANPKFTT